RASLVARTVLRQPRFRKLDDLHTEIGRRGGAVSMALVSRAVKELESELILAGETGMRIRLVQPEKLMDRLAYTFKTPNLTQPSVYRVDLATTELFSRLFQAAEARKVRISMTGLGSAAHHASIATENVIRVYADEKEPLLENLPIKHGERFANLEIHIPRDPVVYFDSERDQQGVLWASPIQTYLEMMHTGDARLQQGAQQLRNKLLSELERRQEAA
ncbi:MAG: hypothetical protein LC772_05590, partial [Chloroflexi bacterium]|nr:hypothetical protein [Chloroflexota bacterium]